MALVKDPVGRAQGVKTPLQGARLYDELETELGMNAQITGTDWETAAEQAVTILKGRFPDVDVYDGQDGPRISREGTKPGGWAPSPSRAAGDFAHGHAPTPHGGRRRSAHSPAPVKQASKPSRGSSGSRQVGGGGRASSSFRAPSVRQVSRAVGATGAASSATDVTFGAIRVMLGLALVYLLLSPRGSRGLSLILNSVGKGFRGILSARTDPLDLLGKPSTSSSTSSTGSTPARPATSAAGNAIRAGTGAGPPAPGMSPGDLIRAGYGAGPARPGNPLNPFINGSTPALGPIFATGPRGQAYRRTP